MFGLKCRLFKLFICWIAVHNDWFVWSLAKLYKGDGEEKGG